jgi:hypothetical protein
MIDFSTLVLIGFGIAVIITAVGESIANRIIEGR